MKSRIWLTMIVTGVALAAVLFAACGASEEYEDSASIVQLAPAPAPTAAPMQRAAPIPTAMPAEAAAAPDAMAAAVAETSAPEEAAADADTSSSGELATLVQQRRIVVRTMQMGLVVADIQASMDSVASIAANMGGWTVSSERSDDFSGHIAVRVPAERLDDAVARVRDTATEVESEVSTSKDVTAEYFDSQSRVRNLRSTETALLNLLEQAPTAKDALEIRNSLTEVQEQLEILLGRLKLLEETSAFSLINVSMRVRRVDLNVDAGDDRTVSIGQTVRFRARFQAPGEASTFRVEWDFGDRSEPIVDGFTAATTEPGARVTATVTHVFSDYRDSPFFVDVRVYGGPDTSPLFGQDTIKVDVIDTEQMPVDAGDDLTVAVGRSVRIRAFFEPPAGINEFTYTWDFGDGTAQVGGNRVILTEDSNRMVTGVTNHVYGSSTESPYIVQIRMVGTGEAGVVEGTDKLVVTVTEVPVLIVSAGEEVTVEEGGTAKFRGTFTRPDGVTNMRYQWSFGDGSAPEDGTLEEGNSVETEHEYVHMRREPYVATLRVLGDSEAGTVEAASSVSVTVVEGEGWVVGGYNIEGNSKSAVRVLTTVVRGVVTVVIWVALLSPLWGGALAVLFLLNWLSRRGGVMLELSRLFRRRPPQGRRPGASMEFVSEGQVECSNCGASNSEDVNFCTGCGSPMKDS